MIVEKTNLLEKFNAYYGEYKNLTPREISTILFYNYGFSYNSVCTLISVTPTQLRKMLKNEIIDNQDNHNKLIQLVSLSKIIETDFNQNPSTFLDDEMCEKSTLTKMDLFNDGKINALLKLGLIEKESLAILDEEYPDWRVTHKKDDTWKVIYDNDGIPSIVPVMPVENYFA